jgi:hypothetical protein
MLKQYSDDDQVVNDVFEIFKRILAGPEGAVRKRIETLRAGGGGFGISDIIEDINKLMDLEGKGFPGAKDTLVGIIEGMPKTQDGSQFMTDAIFEVKGKELQNEIIEISKNIKDLEETAKKGDLTGPQKEQLDTLRKNIASKKKQFSVFAHGDAIDEFGNPTTFKVKELYNQTARILLDRRNNKIRSRYCV